MSTSVSYLDIARRLRLPLGFLLGAGYLVFARPGALGLVTGGGVALIGVVVRGWAAGHIEKNDRLATTGPYAHTRNPLYFGSFLIAAGFAMAVHWALLLLVVAFFVLVYAPNIERERRHIRERFGPEYDDYAENVPAFIPRGRPWRRAGASGRFSWSLYMRHAEWQAGVTYLIVMTWLAFRLMRGF
jgi:protein-S-isoprenylcysteine O-methyltransferase Ste14